MDAITLPLSDCRKLFGSGNADAALLYLYCKSGQPRELALDALRFTAAQMETAIASLRQLGLWDEPTPKRLKPAERPSYTETDVRAELERKGSDFGLLVGEAQRRLGRILSVEELKILLSLTDYLGLSTEVIGILLTYCIELDRARGKGRAPSIRSIEKEAYRWADEGIDTIEEAAGFMQRSLYRRSRIGAIQSRMQLDRRLTHAEEKYILSWLEMGFGENEIAHAYEKTCLNVGGLRWPYMNSILKSWHEQGLHALDEIQSGDRKPAAQKKAAAPEKRQLSNIERAAIARVLRESEENGDGIQ